ncbi:hypothetical protein [Naasia lichenicola]|uniref:Uncharacterized protein n=1 Tax=Naasia lichenicola TaxID=2565933 RepID=A0A4V3WTG3_9MICO|nr:hypothetical protein [Naasia lichenicola]THG30660.1 hypothetical protein E6C64_08450 [Naasia lichenicola]THG31897.1 hypothetical protein E6C64_07595 [Naasia lichenicola]
MTNTDRLRQNVDEIKEALASQLDPRQTLASALPKPLPRRHPIRRSSPVSLVPNISSLHGSNPFQSGHSLSAPQLSPRASKEMEKQTDRLDVAAEAAIYEDTQMRRVRSNRAEIAEQEAADRSFYFQNRMRDAAQVADIVLNQPNEARASYLEPMAELFRDMELGIYRRTFL